MFFQPVSVSFSQVIRISTYLIKCFQKWGRAGHWTAQHHWAADWCPSGPSYCRTRATPGTWDLLSCLLTRLGHPFPGATHWNNTLKTSFFFFKRFFTLKVLNSTYIICKTFLRGGIVSISQVQQLKQRKKKRQLCLRQVGEWIAKVRALEFQASCPDPETSHPGLAQNWMQTCC